MYMYNVTYLIVYFLISYLFYCKIKNVIGHLCNFRISNSRNLKLLKVIIFIFHICDTINFMFTFYIFVNVTSNHL